MSDYQELYEEAMNWLQEQEGYYVSYEYFKEKFEELEWRNSSGVTMLVGDDGDSQIPKRDVRQLVKKPSEVEE